MKLSDKAYNIIKWVVMLLLPALALLYQTIAQTCGLPYADTVGVILNAVAVFLGTITGISTINYNKGNGQSGTTTK